MAQDNNNNNDEEAFAALDAAEQATLDDLLSVPKLLELRKELRQFLLKSHVYTAYDAAKAASLPSASSAYAVKTAVLAFVVGEHMPANASSFADLFPVARATFIKTLNAVAHVARLKGEAAAPTRANSAAVAAKIALATQTTVTVRYETLFADDDRDRVVGFRLHFIFAAPRAAILDQWQKRVRGVTVRSHQRRARPRAANDGEDVSEDASEDAEAAAAAAAAASVDFPHAFAAWSPLGEGFAASFRESRTTEQAIQRLRSQSKIYQALSQRRAEHPGVPVQQPPGLPLALDVTVNLNTVVPFEFLRFRKYPTFYDDVLRTHLRPNNYAVAYATDLAPGQFHDPRPFLQFGENAGEMFDENDSRLSINPDRLFVKEAGLVYFMHDVNGRPRVDRRQTSLRALVAADDDDAALDDDEHRDGDDAEDDMMAMLNDALETEDAPAAAAAASGVRPHQKRLARYLAAKRPDVFAPAYSRPDTVYDVNLYMLLPGTVVLLMLPHAMGTRVNHANLVDGHQAPSDSLMQHWIMATLELEAIDGPGGVHSGSVFRALTAVSARDRIAALLGSENANRRMMNAIEGQRNVVTRAVRREFDLAAAARSPLLFEGDFVEEASTPTTMGVDDFLSTDRMQQRRRERAESSIAERVRASARTALMQGAVQRQQQQQRQALTPEERAELHANVEGSAEFRTNLESLTKDLLGRIEGKIERDLPDLEARDAVRALRFNNTLHRAMLNARMDLANAERRGAPEPPEARRKFKKSVVDFYVQKLAEFDEVFRYSDNVSSANTGEFRLFLNKVCTAEGMAAGLPERVEQSIDAKPFVQYMQTVHDYFIAVARASPQSIRQAMLCFFCALDCCKFLLDRQNPATNLLFNGPTAVGKSFIMQSVARLLVPGLCKTLSNVSPNAFNTETSWDGYVLIFEEFKSSWLFTSSDGKNDTGATPEINFLKERLTSFKTQVEILFRDEKTGRRTTQTTVASHHNVTIGGTNQNVAKMDKPVERRLILNAVPVVVGLDGEGIDDIPDIDTFEQNDANRLMLLRLRATSALFVYVRNAQKAAAFPEVPLAAARYHLKLVQTELRARGVHAFPTSSVPHFITEIAENIQLHYACYMALWSPFARAYHAQPGAPAPWSPQAIFELVTSFMTPTKEAVIESLTMLDFMFAPVHVDRALRDLVLEGLHFDEPARWKLRTFKAADARDPNNIIDPNYLVFTGRTVEELIQVWIQMNKDYRFSPTDMHKIVDRLSNEFVTGPGLRVAAVSGWNNTPSALERDPDAIESRAVVFVERNDTAGRGSSGHAWRIAVLISFIEKRFGVRFDMPSEELRARLATSRTAHPVDAFDAARARHVAHVQPGESVLMDALRHVFNTRVLERSPFEVRGAPLPAPVYEYHTAALHAPLNMSYRHARDACDAPERFVKIALHGTCQFLTLERDTTRNAGVVANTAVMQPTAKRMLAQLSASDAPAGRATAFQNSLGLRATQYDPDFTFECEFLRSICHPGHAFVHALLGDPQRTLPILPLAFGPLSYLVTHQLALKSGDAARFVPYPEENVLHRVRERVEMHAATHLPEAAEEEEEEGAPVRMLDVHAAVGEETFGGVAFGALDPELRRGYTPADAAALREVSLPAGMRALLGDSLSDALDAMDIS